ncbi:MAG: hypothetical protein HXY50_01290 [Ignavibacteriaceae bacterium]|nr:hypothetical protein [Ignavibacteriaceae bacterium]
MKNLNIFSFILLFVILQNFSFSQDINVHYLIGKKQSEVIKKYGEPVHRDNSNPEMLCMFYKNKNNTMIFVANKLGVYQSEALKAYDTNIDALKELDACILGSIEKGFTVDSVTASDFHLRGKGVKAELQKSENVLSKKFEIRMKASKTED